MWIETWNTRARVMRATEEERAWVEEYLSFPNSKARWQRWNKDGRVYMVDDKTGVFPAGFVPMAQQGAARVNLSVELFDRRVPPVLADTRADVGWLHAHQHAALAVARTASRGVFHHATAAGKTEVIVALGELFPCTWLVVTHSKDIALQIVERYAKRTGEHVGMVGDGQFDVRRVTVALFQSLFAGLKRKDQRVVALLRGAQAVAADECFPAGTMVGNTSIEKIRVGDVVPSFDEKDGVLVARRVTGVSRTVPSAMVAVVVGARRLCCTPSHPLWTRRGWVAASELTGRDVVLCTTYAQTFSLPRVQSPDPGRDDGAGVRRILRGVSSRTSEGAMQAHDDGVQSVRDGGGVGGATRAGAGAAGCGVLFSGAQAAMDDRAPVGGVSAPQRRGNGDEDSGADADEQSDAQCRDESESCDKATGGRVEASGSWRERERTHGTAKASRVRAWLGDGGDRADEAGARKSSALQDRRSQPRTSGGDRSGRAEPLLEEGRRSAQGRGLAWIGVDRVEVLEPGSDGTFGGVCPDGAVYNLEVEGTHTYIADGVVAHNCHMVAAATFYRVLMEAVNAYYRYGFSGTPLARGDDKSIYVIGALGPVIHRVRADELIAAGLAARPRIRMVPIGVHSAATTWHEVYAEAVVNNAQRNALIVALAKRAAKPSLVLIERIAHGRMIERALRNAGLNVEFVWGDKLTPQRRAAVRRLEHGDSDVLVANRIFTTGIDIPSLNSVVNGSGSKSFILALQAIGRGMRVMPGKSEFEVWDVADAGNRWMENHTRARKKAYATERHEVVEDTAVLASVPGYAA